MREPLSFREIVNLYQALRADVKKLNRKVEELGRKVEIEVKRITKEKGEELNGKKREIGLDVYGTIINKEFDELTADRKGIGDRFTDYFREFKKQGKKDYTPYQVIIPKKLETNMKNLEEDKWNSLEDSKKIEIEKVIRNISVKTAERLIPVINSFKYNPDKEKGYKITDKQRRYNEEFIYKEKDAAMIDYLVKVDQANQILEPEQQHYFGFTPEGTLETLNISMHYGTDQNLKRILRKANQIIGEEAYPLTVSEILTELSYDLPQFIHNRAIVSDKRSNELKVMSKEFRKKVLIDDKKVDKEKLELYINFLHPELNERELFHLAEDINNNNINRVFGMDRIFDIDDIFCEREDREKKNKIPERNITAKRIDYIKELRKNTQDEKALIEKLVSFFIEGRVYPRNQKIDNAIKNDVEKCERCLKEAGFNIADIKECTKRRSKKLYDMYKQMKKTSKKSSRRKRKQAKEIENKNKNRVDKD